MGRVLGVRIYVRDEFQRLRVSEGVEPQSLTQMVERYWADPYSFLPRCRVSENRKAHYGRRYALPTCEANDDLRKLPFEEKDPDWEIEP